MKRASLSTVAIGAALVALAAGPSGAATQKAAIFTVQNKVEDGNGAAKLSGKIKSSLPICTKGAVIQIFTHGTRLALTHSSKTGAWGPTYAIEPNVSPEPGQEYDVRISSPSGPAVYKCRSSNPVKKLFFPG